MSLIQLLLISIVVGVIIGCIIVSTHLEESDVLRNNTIYWKQQVRKEFGYFVVDERPEPSSGKLSKRGQQ
jgi:hypothetical protein